MVVKVGHPPPPPPPPPIEKHLPTPLACMFYNTKECPLFVCKEPIATAELPSYRGGRKGHCMPVVFLYESVCFLLCFSYAYD